MTFFNITLALSLAVCLAGILLRVRDWLRGCVAPPCPEVRERLRALPGRMLAGMRRGGWRLRLKSLGRNVLLQLHVLRQSPLRWIAHFSIFTGFLGLLFMHAMDGVISYPLLPDYEPTLDPYQFLRNLFGMLTLAGVLLASGRRLLCPAVRRISSWRDWLPLMLIALIVGGGFLLEAVKITSPPVFHSMVEQYFPMAPEEELQALQQLWAAEYGVVFPGLEPDEELLHQGKEINENYCAFCHAPTSSAFVSYPLARGLTDAAPALNALRADRLLWYLHVLLFFLAVALLPWSKFLHVLTTPLQLVARPFCKKPEEHAPTPESTLPLASARSLSLDACTHCGVCSVHCSVAPIFSVLGNAQILPSEKLQGLREFSLQGLPPDAQAAFAEGSFICTECRRCSEVCPSGIDLQDLWLASKNELRRKEQAEPHGLMVRRTASEWAAVFRGVSLEQDGGACGASLSDRRESFWACIQCTTCTSVCPVVALADDPVQELDLTPQQIMNLMRMGLKELALGSRMVWSCVTCYKCQEHCPQGVRVADVLYELRNIASRHLREGRVKPPAPRGGGWS